jgi:hypothetical protein
MPSTAICPGCDTMVVLPVDPRGADDPLICGTCGSEVPDFRLEQLAAAAAAAEAAAIAAEVLPENRIYTRRSLLQGLRDSAADKALQVARGIARDKF